MAILGTFSGLAIGAFNGAWSGAILGLIFGFGGRNRRQLLFAGIAIGSGYAIRVGTVAGALAFFIATFIAWRAPLFAGNWRALSFAAFKGATGGTLLGAVVVGVNFGIYRWLFGGTGNALFFYIGGVVLGFVLGLFAAVIRSTLRIVETEREAASQTK